MKSYIIVAPFVRT